MRKESKTNRESYYFSHDYGARNDPKILELRAEYGLEGLGLYWCIVETLAEADDGYINPKLLAGLSIGYGVTKAMLQELIDFMIKVELLREDDNGYFIVDHFSRQIALDLTLVQHYSNIELDIDDVTVDGKQINIYDYIVENGIVNEVKELMDCREYDFFIDLLEESIQNKLDSENSIEASVVKVKNRIFELVDKANVQLDKFNLKELQKVGKSLIKDLNKNPEVIDRLKDVLLINKEVNGVD